MKKIIGFILVAIVLLTFVACGGGSSSISNRNDYSDTYNSNDEYRHNVKDIADVYGISESEVDAKINAVTRGN